MAAAVPVVTASTIFFDVDFTLIHPGPTFEAAGYRQFAVRHGFDVDPARYEPAVEAASAVLDAAQDDIYRAELFYRYAERVLEEMGGTGPGLAACAREIYDEWARCQHFQLYADVQPTLARLHAAGFTLGLISNTHRCLAAFQSHFELEGYVAAALSSSDHGYMKPHPSIFQAALALVGADASDAVMVGDSVTHDIAGAWGVGMGGILITRAGQTGPASTDVPTVRSLTELPDLLRRP